MDYNLTLEVRFNYLAEGFIEEFQSISLIVVVIVVIMVKLHHFFILLPFP